MPQAPMGFDQFPGQSRLPMDNPMSMKPPGPMSNGPPPMASGPPPMVGGPPPMVGGPPPMAGGPPQKSGGQAQQFESKLKGLMTSTPYGSSNEDDK